MRHYTTDVITNGDLRHQIELREMDGVWQQRHTFYDDKGTHVEQWITRPAPNRMTGFREVEEG